MIALLRDVCSVFKLRIGMAITATALAGMAVTPGPRPATWQVLVLAATVLLSSAGAGAFNQIVERESDALMARTRNRPFVTGRFRFPGVWLVGILLMLAASVAAAALAIGREAALLIFLGAFTYGFVYTVWLKRRTSLNIVVGGLAGSFAVLAGAAAVTPVPAPAPVILAVVLFLWTPPHFWSLALALRDEYADAVVPMLPVVVGEARAARIILAHTLALSVLSLLPFWFGLGWIYLLCAAGGGAFFLSTSLRLARQPGPAAAWRNFHASLAQLSLLLLGAIFSEVPGF